MPAAAATRNVAGGASAAASNEPIPVQYWIRALNDGKVRKNPLPPEMWGSWTGTSPARPWIEYRWHRPVTPTGPRHWFFSAHAARPALGVGPPRPWTPDTW